MSDIDLSKNWTVPELLMKVKGLYHCDVELLHRAFIDTINVQNGCIAGDTPNVCRESTTFTIFQWNMLAQALSTGKDNFAKCPKEALHWNNRKWKILEEVLRVNPDVVCLQEVDHYDFISRVMKVVGYSGRFFPKPDSPALYAPESNGPDGCAMFYNNSKLELMNEKCQVLQSNGTDTNQVCIMSKFKSKENNKIFSVATTHLKAKAGWNELRLSQGLDLLEKVKQFSAGDPTIVCGDFNADPSEEVINAFKTSDLQLNSCYDLNHDLPQYTTWKIRGGGGKESEVCRIIDYMFYTYDKMRVTSLLSIPTEGEIGKDRLPSYAYPSDHMSLAIKMSL